MEKKIDVVGQMILAAIPGFIAPLYAFYKIKKLKKGILLALSIIGIETVIFFIYGDFTWNDFINGKEITGPINISVGFILALLVEILLQVYFARKWTIEYNERIETSAV